MLRRLFVCMTTVAVIGISATAQETVHGTSSNAHLELCCGGKHIETGEKKLGAFYKTAAGIFRGKVKQLNNKEIVIENDVKQMVSIRRSRQTKFFKDDQPIKSSDIDLETPVTIDAREAANVSLFAIKVSVDSPPPTTDLRSTVLNSGSGISRARMVLTCPKGDRVETSTRLRKMSEVLKKTTRSRSESRPGSLN